MRYTFLLCGLLLSFGLAAQKRPITAADFDTWKSLQSPQLSDNGQWAIYEKNPQDGDGQLMIHRLGVNSSTDSVARGYKAQLTPNGQFLLMLVAPPKDSMQAAKRAKKKTDELPKDAFTIYDLATKKTVHIPQVTSYQRPEKSNDWVAYQLAVPTAKGGKQKGKKPSKEQGTDLIIRNLADVRSTSFPFVKTFAVPKNGNKLAFYSTGNDSTFKAGVYVVDAAKHTAQPILLAPKASCSQLEFSEDGEQLAFVADLDTNTKQLRRNPQLYYWKSGQATAQLLADSSRLSSPKNWLISEHGSLRFSKDGTKLFFGTAPRGLLKDTTQLEEDIVKVDIWNWQDNTLMTQQLANLKTESKRSYLAVYNLPQQRMVQLGQLTRPNIELAAQGNASFVVATTNQSYSNNHWDWGNLTDIYTIGTTNGEATAVAMKQRLGSRVQVSPAGKYIYWFDRADTTWRAYEVATKQLIQLTKLAAFSDAEEDDHPDYPNPYGVAGWTTDDATVWLYDRYDIWEANPKQPQALQRLTDGRAKQQQFRYIKNNDPDVRWIDAKKPVLLTTYDNLGQQLGGYAWWKPTTKSIDVAITAPFRFGTDVVKAKKADTYLFTKENFTTFPDLWVAQQANFQEARQLSVANPQQQQLQWGSVEIVEWTSLDGIPLKGLLYKPEGFDASKKYPMITYFYEKNSMNLHEYHVPQPVRASVNYPYYTSNGYLIFVPDIVYKVGYPGPSAYNCIMPGVLKLLQTGYVNEKKLGLQGHSWGGYQTAYLITQTNLFAAAEAGAPVSNMTSAYGGIRWDSGLSRQAQYEQSQSRLGKSLWEMPQHYIENSPLFYAPRVETPLLMLHNDDDGAVPWEQGIEFFMALKRLNKPVWLLNYNGEKHGLTQRKNKKDWSRRLMQFFDHYLKDSPAPTWLKSGVRATEKTLNYGWDEAVDNEELSNK